MVQPDPPRHRPHVCAGALADVSDLVDKADLGRQEGVRSVFDHLGTGQVCVVTAVMNRDLPTRQAVTRLRLAIFPYSRSSTLSPAAR